MKNLLLSEIVKFLWRLDKCFKIGKTQVENIWEKNRKNPWITDNNRKNLKLKKTNNNNNDFFNFKVI